MDKEFYTVPHITAMLLGRAVSDALNPAHGDWNKAFRDAVEVLSGVEPSFSVSAENLSAHSSDNAYQVRVIVTSEGQQIVGTVAYRRLGVRNLSLPVTIG